jgi:hypothetical protein
MPLNVLLNCVGISLAEASNDSLTMARSFLESSKGKAAGLFVFLNFAL